jgi:hypothetical protein
LSAFLHTNRRKLLASALALALLATLQGLGMTWSAFSGAAGNTASNVVAGSVALTDNDSGSAMFTMSGMVPNDTDTSCIKVTSTGTLPSLVKLYGTVSGTGLASYLTMTVTRGTAPNGFDDCTGFTPDSANAYGLGAGVLYSGNMSSYPADWSAGIADPHTASVNEAWTTSEVHTYKVQVTLQNNAAAASKTAGLTLTWEARNTTLYSQVVMSDDPVSYWKLDEAAGTSAADSAGAVTGTYVNNPTLGQQGVKDGANGVYFDGVSARVNYGDNYAFTGTTAFSAELWVKPTTPNATYRRLLSKKFTGGSLGGWELYMTSTGDATPGKVIFGREDTVDMSRADSVTALPIGVWSHVLATYGGNYMKMYLNGTLTETRASTRVIPSTAGTVLMAAASSTNTNRLVGSLDEIAIYNRALTAQEAADHYNAGKR